MLIENRIVSETTVNCTSCPDLRVGGYLECYNASQHFSWYPMCSHFSTKNVPVHVVEQTGKIYNAQHNVMLEASTLPLFLTVLGIVVGLVN